MCVSDIIKCKWSGPRVSWSNRSSGVGGFCWQWSKKQNARGSPAFSRVLVAPIPSRMMDVQSTYLRSCEWIDMRGQRVIWSIRRDGLEGVKSVVSFSHTEHSCSSWTSCWNLDQTYSSSHSQHISDSLFGFWADFYSSSWLWSKKAQAMINPKPGNTATNCSRTLANTITSGICAIVDEVNALVWWWTCDHMLQ